MRLSVSTRRALILAVGVMLVMVGLFAIPAGASHLPCTVTGTPGDDVLVGTSGNDVLCGKGGDDQLYGGPGNDELNGDAGNDLLHARTGTDILRGGTGNDTLLANHGPPGGDQLNGQGGVNLCAADAGDSVAACAPIQSVVEDVPTGTTVDQDVWSFTAAPGTTIVAVADTVATDTAFDVVGCIGTQVDAFGTCFAFADDNWQCTFEPPAFGCPWYVTVTLPADADGVYYWAIEEFAADGAAGNVYMAHLAGSGLGALTLVFDDRPGETG
jgi:Ca2+-binding RTX toxin-like protein